MYFSSKERWYCEHGEKWSWSVEEAVLNIQDQGFGNKLYSQLFLRQVFLENLCEIKRLLRGPSYQELYSSD
jgi:hypothetical protein